MCDEACMNILAARLARWGCGWAGAVLDTLLPPQCLACDAPVGGQGQFCAVCFSAAHFIVEPCCRSCGSPFAHASEGQENGLCLYCHDDPPPWSRARAALQYDALSKRVVLPLKYGDRTELATSLGAMMVRAGRVLLDGADTLVPVPLHRRKLLSRRFNQAVLLANAVGRRSGVPVVPDALERSRFTKPLGALPVGARHDEVEGAFTLRAGRGGWVAGRRVLLIDDVLTTGATCRACTKVLLAAGAAQVDVLVAARVPDPRLR